MRVRLICAISLVCLAGCSPYLDQRADEPQNAADAVRMADLRPRFPKPAPAEGGSTVGGGGGGFTIFGSNGAPAPIDPSQSNASSYVAEVGAGEAVKAVGEAGDGYTLNFENSPVANVAKAVLGDILGLRYTIDPRAQGSVTLSSSQPIPKRDLLYVLESALRANNLALVKEGSGYRIALLGEGGTFGGADRADGPDAAAPGYGTTVVPLHYVSGATLSRLLEGFAIRPGAVRADPSGRLLVVTGSGDERRNALATIAQFDVDWLRGQSVGLYPIHNSSSTAVASELDKILDTGESGLGHGLVKLQDITAQNAVLVVAGRPNLLAAAARWISRLDTPNLSGAGVHVYKLHYGDAKQVARLLNSMFGSGAQGESDSNQLAPGAGGRLSTVDRLTGSRPQSGQPPGGGFTGGAPGQPPGPGGGASGGGFGAPNAGGGPSPFGSLQNAALNSAFADAAQGGGGASLLQGVRITADAEDNSLLIYAGAESYRTIERAVQQIDRPKAQVAIDVTIAEVTLNDQLNYGVQFYLTNHILQNIGSLVNTGTGLPLNPTQTGGQSSGFNIFIGSLATPHAVINALHQLTDVKVLSNPSLVVVDNQEATLEVGDQVPVPTGSATVLTGNNAVVNTIDYKNTGIILDVIPRVSPDNTIQLDISQEISNVVANSATTAAAAAAGQLAAPTISERKVKSQITVTSGQMVMLAGLVSETQSRDRSGIPGLDQLPYVGGAFGSSDKGRQRTELIMLIKPQVIRDSVDASRVAEQLRAKMQGGRIQSLSIPSALQIGAKPY